MPISIAMLASSFFPLLTFTGVRVGVAVLRNVANSLRAVPLPPETDRSEGILRRTQREASVGEVLYEVKCRLPVGSTLRRALWLVGKRHAVNEAIQTVPWSGARSAPFGAAAHLDVLQFRAARGDHFA